MERTHGPDITFTIHRRPESEERIGRAEPMVGPVVPTPAYPVAAVPDLPRHRDTVFGDLIFLARFAFGRY